MSDERHPTSNACRKLVEWLNYCREIGWPSEDMKHLADLWWKYHDDQGKLIRRAAP